MRKILLFLVFSIFFAGNAQNYYGTQFIGESGTNTPQGFAKYDKTLVLSGLLGGSLTGSYPITFAGGNADGILTSINHSDGSINWIKQFGGGGDEVVVDTTMDSSGNYYLTGYMTGAGSNSLDADPGPGVYQLPVVSLAANRDIFIIKLDSNGDFVWGKKMCSPSGAGNDDAATIKLDSAGNIYVAGSFVYLNFDPNGGSQTYTSVGNADAFIVKLDNNGNFVWVDILPGTSTKKINDMEIDSSDNIYVLGRFQGTIDLNPDTTATDIRTTAGSFDTFVAKYTSSGTYVWGQSYGGTGSDTPEKIILNGSNLYVSGAFSKTVDLDPTAGTNTYTAVNSEGYFSKFGTDGSYATSYVIVDSTTNANTIKDILFDASGNIVVSGLFQNMTINSTNYSTPYTNADAFFLRLNPDLSFSSIYLVQGSLAQSIPFIQQLSDGKYIAAGGSKGTTDFDYTSNTSPETAPIALVYTYLTKFDYDTTLLSTSNTNVKSNLAIYPNPAESEVNVVSNGNIKSAKIYNMEGKLVFSQEKENLTKINISVLPKGNYIIQTNDGKGNVGQTKLIKK